jgi:catechol 2,3-dioxygenase-like lactoylglutathione lyase family enzyme
VRLGATTLRLVGPDSSGRRGGITAWSVAGLVVAPGTVGDLDGLPTTFQAPVTDPGPPPDHDNGVIGLDHVVVQAPDLDRTIAALGAAGLGCRRIRETTSYRGAPMRQAFFRLGPTILEVVSEDAGAGLPVTEAPATWFGLALDVADLDHTATVLGDGLGSVKAAVQAGRRIATLRSEELGLSVAVAAMDHHGGR